LSDRSCAYFRLTENGLEAIRACRQTGFHPHPYTDDYLYQVRCALQVSWPDRPTSLTKNGCRWGGDGVAAAQDVHAAGQGAVVVRNEPLKVCDQRC